MYTSSYARSRVLAFLIVMIVFGGGTWLATSQRLIAVTYTAQEQQGSPYGKVIALLDAAQRGAPQLSGYPDTTCVQGCKALLHTLALLPQETRASLDDCLDDGALRVASQHPLDGARHVFQLRCGFNAHWDVVMQREGSPSPVLSDANAPPPAWQILSLSPASP